MNFRNLLRNKGLVIAVSALVLLFLFLLLTINAIQGNSVNYVRHVETIDSFSKRLELTSNTAQLSSLKKEIQSFTSANEFKEPLMDELNSSTSDINKLISSVESGSLNVDVRPAQNALMKAKASMVIERDKKAGLARYVLIAAAILSLLVLILIIFPIISRMANSEDTANEAKKESEGIMGTVSEGLFLLTKENDFGIEQSSSLREIFRSEGDLEGNFFEFIAKYVPQSTVQIAQDYLGLLYGDRVKEKLVKDLNPLNEVEIHIVRRDGSFETKFLNFKFSRVMQDKTLSHLLGSVTDATREVKLRLELEESKEEQEAQLDLLMNILHIDNELLTRFFESADTTLIGINQSLESKGHTDSEIRKKLKNISEKAHGLKGDAAALGLHKFEFAVHSFEDSIVEVQSTTKTISGKQLLPAVTQLKILFTELQNMRGLVSKFASNFANSDGAKALENSLPSSTAVNSTAYSELEQPLQNIVATVSERTNKRASLVTFGLDNSIDLPEALSEAVVSICVQLIRNSIVHGGLEPAERLALNKTDYLNITTSLTETDEGYMLIIRDDGEGINEQAIIQRAVELGHIKQEDVAGLAPGDASKLIFKSGFSTTQNPDLDSGRGVGLNAVYNMIVEAGGKLSLRHKQGSYCQFQVFFAHQIDDA